MVQKCPKNPIYGLSCLSDFIMSKVLFHLTFMENAGKEPAWSRRLVIVERSRILEDARLTRE